MIVSAKRTCYAGLWKGGDSPHASVILRYAVQMDGRGRGGGDDRRA